MCRSQDAVSFSLKNNGLVSRSNTNNLSIPMKPILPRKLTSSARINLNKYWNTLEELVIPARNPQVEDSENMINENLDNEHRLELMTISGGGKSGFGGRSPFSQHNARDTCTQNGDSS